jgi:hypothetical protein
MEDSEWLAELKKNLVITDKTMCNLKELYSKVYSDLTSASDEIDDLEHAIEFKTVNATQAISLWQNLKGLAGRVEKLRMQSSCLKSL